MPAASLASVSLRVYDVPLGTNARTDGDPMPREASKSIEKDSHWLRVPPTE